MRVGLVLGAGGVIGGAYHAGALTALEHDLGWDVRTADVIVGTSAGALTGALLRSGIPPSDLAAWTVGAPLSPDGIPIANVLHPEFDPVSLRMFLRLPRIPHPDAVISTLRRPHRFDPMRAFMTHMRDGERTLSEHVEFLGSDWPERDLYLTACRRRDGQRTVFGRSVVPKDGLRAAVAASCAVPGYFAPVTVDGVQYIDGGIASPTNADVVRDCDLDLLLVLSPMTTTARLPRYSAERIVRDRAGHRLHRELRSFERAGIPTVVFEPGPEVLEHVTADFMSEEHINEIVRAAFLETGSRLQTPECRTALASLATRTAA